MFIASFGISVKFHIGLRLSVIFADTVDYDMHMNIATAIMTVSVSTDKCLVSGEILFGIFHAKLLCQFSSQSMFVPVFGIEADDIVVGLDFIVRLVLMKISICFLTFRCKGKWIAVYTVKVIFLTNEHVTVFIKNGFLCIFVMLKNQITFSFSIICIFTCDMFQYCHESHLPFPLPYISFRINLEVAYLFLHAFPEKECRPD